MAREGDLVVGPEVTVKADEVRYRTSRSSGPGGQNVNKVETRVTLLFDLEATRSLSDEQKRRVRRRLATRVTKDGVLRVVSQRHRTQAANRRAAEEKFVEAEMNAYVAVTKRRRGELIGGDEGRELVDAGNAWLAGQGIQNPTAWARMYAPGFGE